MGELKPNKGVLGGNGKGVRLIISRGPFAGTGAQFKTWTEALRWCDQQTGLEVVNRAAAQELADAETKEDADE